MNLTVNLPEGFLSDFVVRSGSVCVCVCTVQGAGHYVIYRIKVLPPYSFHLTCVSITNNTSHSHSPVCQCSSVPRISPCRLVDCQTGSCSIRKYVNLLRGNKQPPFLSAGQHVTVFVHRRKIFFGRQLSQMYQFA